MGAIAQPGKAGLPTLHVFIGLSCPLIFVHSPEKQREVIAHLVGPRVALIPQMPTVQRDPVAASIIGAAIEVHRCLGPGLMESAYQMCLAYEFQQRGLRVEKEVAIPVMFKGVQMACGFRADFVVDGAVIVEIKCVERLTPLHTAQVLTYLRLTDARQAFLINFNGLTLKEGLKSFLRGGKLSTQ